MLEIIYHLGFKSSNMCFNVVQSAQRGLSEENEGWNMMFSLFLHSGKQFKINVVLKALTLNATRAILVWWSLIIELGHTVEVSLCYPNFPPQHNAQEANKVTEYVSQYRCGQWTTTPQVIAYRVLKMQYAET
jgi:hypothetical protein